MTIIDNKNSEEFNQQGAFKKWLWLIPLFGLCIFSLLFAGGGLVLWQTLAGQPEHKEAADIISLQPDKHKTTPSPSSTSSPLPVDSKAIVSNQGDTIRFQVSTPTSPAQVSQSLPGSCEVSRSFDSLAVTTPILSPISFATHQDDNGWPLDAALQFTTAVTRVQAFFGYAGMRSGMTWERVWYFGDQEMLRGSGVWDAGSRGQLTLYAQAGEGGFVAGRYRLALYVEGELLSYGSFLMVGEDTPVQQPVQVAYTTWDGSKHQINLFDLDSSASQPLVEYARKPAWSPDTTDLLFYGENDTERGSAGLWALDISQGKTYQISEEASFQSIAWSPHRTFVASSVVKEQEPHLILWDLLQNKAYNGPPGEDPAWSPEGQRLAYRRCNGGKWNISAIQVISNVFDIDSIQQLTTGDDSRPAWSWDGQRIAFARRDNSNQDIYTINVDGSNLIRLTDHPAVDTSPVWTPDNRLLFSSLRNGQWGIYIMDVDGANQHLLFNTPSQPGWRPDHLAVSANVRLVEPTPTPLPKPKIHIPPGYGMLVVSNKQNNDEMTFTIDSTEHKIMPFQVEMLPLKPGHYTWTASWPAKTGHNGIADIAAGQVAYPVVER